MPLENADIGLAEKFYIEMAGPNGKAVGIEYDPALRRRPWGAFEQQSHGIRLGGSGASLEDAIKDLERVKVNMGNGDKIVATVRRLAQTEQAQTVANQSAPFPAN